jgi:hypothetical protein
MNRKNPHKRNHFHVFFYEFFVAKKWWKNKFLSIRLIFSEICFIKKNRFLSKFFFHNRLENQVLDTYCGHLKVQEISKKKPKGIQRPNFFSV